LSYRPHQSTIIMDELPSVKGSHKSKWLDYKGSARYTVS